MDRGNGHRPSHLAFNAARKLPNRDGLPAAAGLARHVYPKAEIEYLGQGNSIAAFLRKQPKNIPLVTSTTEAPPWGLFASFSVSATTACCQSCSSKRSFDCLGRSLPELSAGQFVSGLGQSFVYFVC